jgi:antitoxin component YwqK of YwqJK toxin-antitoxin module
MSNINGKKSEEWIEENHPENGLFRVYWKDPVPRETRNSGGYTTYDGGATFDPEEGEGLRYKWYYEKGHRADGLSRSWWPNGNLKQTVTWKNGKRHGLWTEWYENGELKWRGSRANGQYEPD